MQPKRMQAILRVRSRSADSSHGILFMGNRSFSCRLGHSGISARKREGDGATPLGSFGLLHVFYRADRVRRPRTGLPVHAIRPDDGWCDAPGDRNYNRPVPLPYDASAEQLWREDHLYDLVLVLDHNISRRSRGRGSAIFMHLLSADGKATEGCVALQEKDLRAVLTSLNPGQRIQIKA